MKILVEVYGALRRRFEPYDGPITLDVPGSGTVGSVVKALGITGRDAWNASLRGKLASSRDALHEGDRLLIFDAIGGG